MHRAPVVGLILVVTLLSPVPAVAGGELMSVQNFQFAPASVQIRPGQEVDFNFEGPSRHTATLRAGQTDRYDSGVTGPGFTKRHRFRHPGRFRLHCRLHPSMTARVRVGTPEVRRPRIADLEARPGFQRVRVTARISERSVVTVTIGSKRVRRVLGRGTRSILARGLRSGRHTAELTATDGWGNTSATARKSFRVS